jgi:acetyl-CoA carboxylase biotin carboxyl carrier protein
MDLSLVKKLVKLLSESDVDEIEIEEEGKKIRIAKHQQRASAPATPAAWVSEPARQATSMPANALPPHAAAPSGSPAETSATAPAAANLTEIRCPIVGTFYRAPAPDAAPFVQIGSEIQPGMVLCIVEAMKLMNEIESDVAGKVAKVMVENGQPVEYDQVLFLIEKL